MSASLRNAFRRFADHLIESPCIAVCIMNTETGLCKGCYRTIAEIAGWPEMTGEQKREVLANSAARKSAARP